MSKKTALISAIIVVCFGFATMIGVNIRNKHKVVKVDVTAEAKNWLELTRQGHLPVEFHVEQVKTCLDKAGALPLSTIGTSEEELQQLLVNGYIAEAKNWLELTRQGHLPVEFHVEQVKTCLDKAGNLPLSTIGTSNEELEGFI